MGCGVSRAFATCLRVCGLIREQQRKILGVGGACWIPVRFRRSGPDRIRGKECSCFCHQGRKYSRNWGLPEERSPQSGAHQALNQNLVATFDSRGVDSYSVLMGPGYSDTSESMVNSVTPSTVAWATKILSKGSL
jgi:hypothetical protein